MARALLQRMLRKLTGKRPSKNKYCVVCRNAVEYFAPYRGGWAASPPLMRLLDVVGSDLDNWSCPSCGAHDRERHLLLYLERLGLLERITGAQVLHFAPEKRLSKIFLKLEPSRYVRGDLFPSEPEIQKLDLLAIDFPDASFDIVFANHVLEHVSDDQRGVSEVRRVLRPGGFAILQTPYSTRLHHTIEDPGVDDEITRNELFGQEDHVRLFGRDIFERFARSGLVADVKRHADILPDIDAERYGISCDEPLFLFHCN